MHERIPSTNMEQEIIKAGFNIEQKLFRGDFLYFLIVKKKIVKMN